jgi:hypothetical protein
MGVKSVVLGVLFGTCVLLLQVGCQEEALVAEASVRKAEAGEKKESEGPAAEVETGGSAGKKGPRITFEKLVHDFGDVGPGSKNTCEFNFTNTGDSLLKITKVSKSCGCTPYTLAKMEYDPGESGTLKVSYSASRRPGSAKKKLHVTSNDKKKPRVELTVQAHIIPKVSYEPERLNLVLNKENGGCPEIKLKSLDGKAFAIKQVKSTGRFKSSENCITADFDPSIKATEHVIRPKVDIEKAKKSVSGNVQIRLTHPESGTINIPFKMVPRFQLKPGTLSVLKAEGGQPVRREVWILNNYGEDFEIESTSSKSGTIEVLKQEKVGERYKLELEITPPPEEGTRRAWVDELYVQIKDGEKLKITCRGFYKPRQQAASK